MSDEDNDRFVVRCRGLPWSTSVDEIANFFSDCEFKEGNSSVHLTLTREGRPSGEAYIELASEEDVEKALKKDKQHMGKRYVEVFKSKYSEMEWVIKRAGRGGSDEGTPSRGNSGGNGPANDNVIRLRGLPFDCTKADIAKFFDGLEITNNGILLTTDYQGRSSGEAYVHFASKNHAERALEKNKQSIGHRYIEVFRSSMLEAQRAQMGGGGGSGGYGRGGGGGGGGGGPPRGGRDYGGYGNGGGMRGGRPSPYERMSNGPPLGRGYGAYGPSSRGPRPMKSFGGDDGGYGGYGGRSSMGPIDDGPPSGGFGSYGDDGYGMGMRGGGSGSGMGMGMGMGGGGAPSLGHGNDGGYMGPSGGMRSRGGPSHVVHMRGLPFRVTENDIAEWFSSVVDPMDILIMYNPQGRPTGEADVIFASEADALKAMTKDRQNMQHRYIELFYDGAGSPPSGGRGGSGGPSRSGGPMGGYGSGMSQNAPFGPPRGSGFGMSAGNGNGYSNY